MRCLLLAAAALVAATSAAAQAPSPPKLTILISIDGLSDDLINEYRPQLGGGLAEVVAQPQTSGTIGNVDQVVAVSGDSAAMAPIGGVALGQRWFWNGRAFASDTPAASPPRTIPLANSAIEKIVARGEPALVPPPYCQAKGSASGLRFARAPGDYAAFEASPSLDGATLALAAGLVQDLGLGRDAAPDMLSIRLPATARVVRAHGSASEETCLQLFALDRELGDFLQALARMKLDHSVRLQR